LQDLYGDDFEVFLEQGHVGFEIVNLSNGSLDLFNGGVGKELCYGDDLWAEIFIGKFAETAFVVFCTEIFSGKQFNNVAVD
jgi:hypothetical protein